MTHVLQHQTIFWLLYLFPSVASHPFTLPFSSWIRHGIQGHLSRSFDDPWADFGAFKRNGIKEHLFYMFDHTTVVAADDPLWIRFRVVSQD